MEWIIPVWLLGFLIILLLNSAALFFRKEPATKGDVIGSVVGAGLWPVTLPLLLFFVAALWIAKKAMGALDA